MLLTAFAYCVRRNCCGVHQAHYCTMLALAIEVVLLSFTHSHHHMASAKREWGLHHSTSFWEWLPCTDSLRSVRKKRRVVFVETRLSYDNDDRHYSGEDYFPVVTSLEKSRMFSRSTYPRVLPNSGSDTHLGSETTSPNILSSDPGIVRLFSSSYLPSFSIVVGVRWNSTH